MTSASESSRDAENPLTAGGEPVEGTIHPEVTDLREALGAAEAKATENRDLYLRALAEMDNMRKRAARDVEQAHKYALEKFAQDLINVKDSLEMGLQAGQAATAEGLVAGMQATLQLLNKAFERAGVNEIDPVGQAFNPEVHEAMVTQESPEHGPNTVLQVVQKGYQLNGRLLRPARVIVSR
jgi:molecular chaperone GrpE